MVDHCTSCDSIILDDDCVECLAVITYDDLLNDHEAARVAAIKDEDLFDRLIEEGWPVLEAEAVINA